MRGGGVRSLGGGIRARRGRGLVELIVALTILALGGTLATRLLVLAHREMDGAELELRGVLHLSEVAGADGVDPPEGRQAGPGLLRWQREEDRVEVWYEPPGQEAVELPTVGTGGFLVLRSWILEDGP